MSVAKTAREPVRRFIETFPRFRLAHLPTPMERADALSNLLGVNLYIKREDQTGLAMGGNKTRKLEFVMGDVREQGADSIVSWAGLQSNWCRQLAAASRKARVKLSLLLFRRTGLPSEFDGNLLLDALLGAECRIVDQPIDRNTSRLAGVAEMLEYALERDRRAGLKTYIAPIGASLTEGSMTQPLGAIAYVDAVFEMAEQASSIDFEPTSVIVATGSGGMQAGIIAGAKMLWPQARVWGIGVCDGIAEMSTDIALVVQQVLEEYDGFSGNKIHFSADDVVLLNYVRQGYGMLDPDTMEAVRTTANAEGLLLDPVYTGKAMAATFDLAKRGELRPGEKVVFIHSGGLPALFPYRKQFEQALSPERD